MSGFTIAHLFADATEGAGAAHRVARIGAELELLAMDAVTDKPALLDGALGDWLRHAAHAGGWTALQSQKGAPKYDNGLGTVTLEPGGQVEFSSQPITTVDALSEIVERVGNDLIESARAHNIRLTAVGIDPVNPIEAAPQQLDAPRYRAMDEFFRAVSPAGLRMMRQTAALQISIDPMHDSPKNPHRTWKALNRAAPVLTAMFANSRYYERVDTGYASYRAQTWIELDPSRTGLFAQEDAIAAYTTFAANARVIADRPNYRRFADIDEFEFEKREERSDAFWTEHLTTLFPEVRPKKFLEVRSIDSIPLQYLCVAFAAVAAIAWDETTLGAVEHELPSPDRTSWERAARYGLRDDQLAAGAHMIARHAMNAFPNFAPRINEWMLRSVATGGPSFEHDFVGDDHVADDAITRLGK